MHFLERGAYGEHPSDEHFRHKVFPYLFLRAVCLDGEFFGDSRGMCVGEGNGGESVGRGIDEGAFEVKAAVDFEGAICFGASVANA